MKTLLSALFLLFSYLPLNANCDAPAVQGRIEWHEGQRVMHLKGSPYEIGFQHGSLLKDDIQYNLQRFIGSIGQSGRQKPAVVAYFLEALPNIISFLPEALVEEMQGVADGAGVPYNKILMLNLFPEMFHCTGIAAGGKATENGILYHVRVLDYAVADDIQDTAVLAIVQPDEGLPFMNVTYAGFIGCVTGMNLEKISIGEIGGKGYGYWNGMPMPFLLRQILQHAASLEDIKMILSGTPRTCEYYYVFADGKDNSSMGVYATYSELSFISPGKSYRKFFPVPDAFDPIDAEGMAKRTVTKSTSFNQPDDCILILRNGFYDLLLERLRNSYGRINLNELQEAIKEPIANGSNLHNAIFAPASLDVWISHRSLDGEPACDMPYVHYNLSEMVGE